MIIFPFFPALSIVFQCAKYKENTPKKRWYLHHWHPSLYYPKHSIKGNKIMRYSIQDFIQLIAQLVIQMADALGI